MSGRNRCIGIFGGMFDPIHYGHLRTALELLHQLALAEVRFVPCRNPPHRDAPLMSAELRLQMVSAAVQSEPLFKLDPREIRREGFSYTVDTLAELRAENPETPLSLLMGMDTFLGMPTWHDWSRIFDLAHVAVARRPGWQAPTEGVLAKLLADRGTESPLEVHESLCGKIHIATVTQLEISSTELRNSIAAGVDPMYLVPQGVRALILETETYAKRKRTVA